MREDTQNTRIALYSGLGSVPLHLSPVLLIILMQTGSSRYEASAVVSAIFLGELAFAILSPAFPIVTKLTRCVFAVSVAMITLAMLSMFVGFVPLLIIWFLLGGLSGFCSHVGIVFAAVSKLAFKLYSIRLASALMTSGIVCGLLLLPIWELGYDSFAMSFSLVIGLVLIVTLYGARLNFVGSQNVEVERQPPNLGDALPLVGIALFFAVIVAYLSQIEAIFPALASNTDIIQSVAMSKIMGGVMLGVVVSVVREGRLQSYGIASIVCTAILFALGQNALIFVSAVVFLLSLELFINISSSLIFKAAAQASSAGGKNLLFLAMLLGSTLGPILGATLIEHTTFEGLQVVCGAVISFFVIFVLRFYKTA